MRAGSQPAAQAQLGPEANESIKSRFLIGQYFGVAEYCSVRRHICYDIHTRFDRAHRLVRFLHRHEIVSIRSSVIL
jgi:hypothetical protein